MSTSRPIILAGGYDARVVPSPVFDNDDNVNRISEMGFDFAQTNRIISLPNNKIIVAGNPYFYVCDLYNNNREKYTGHQTNITDLVCNENKIYTCSEDSTWRIWELHNDSNSRNARNQYEKKVQTNSPLNSIQVTRDGRYIFVANERGEVELYDAQSDLNNIVDSIKLSESPVRSIALSVNNERLIAACHDGVICVLAIDYSSTSKILENKIARSSSSFTVFSELAKFQAHDNVILRCIISPDQKTFVTTSADSTAKIWDFNNYSELFKLADSSIKKWVWDAAYTADSKFIITGGTDKICITWDVSNGQKVSSKELKTKGITALTICDYVY